MRRMLAKCYDDRGQTVQLLRELQPLKDKFLQNGNVGG